MTFDACLLADFRPGTDFDQSLQATAFRHSRPVGCEVHETLADAGDRCTVVGQD